MKRTLIIVLGIAVVAATIGLLALGGCRRQEVPDVVGMRQAEAVRALQDAGYKLGEVSAIATNSVDVGLIAAQDPPAGERLREGEAVALQVNFNDGVDAIVPTLIGLQEVTAVNVVNATRLTPLVTEQYSADAPEGEVFAQVPDAGAKVRANSTVVVVVSKGKEPEKGEVPNVKDKSRSAAESAIKDAGFVSEAFEVFDSQVAKGNVIGQVPDPGTSMTKGSTVQIVVSLGKGTGTVKVPNVTGQTEANASNALGKAGLKAKVYRQYSSSVAKGVVGQQFPAAGASTIPGAEVAIVVSLGKEPASTVAVPNVVGRSQADAVSAIQSAGLVAQVLPFASSDVAKGNVGFQFPSANAQVTPGSQVLVVVSSGPPPSDGGSGDGSGTAPDDGSGSAPDDGSDLGSSETTP